MNYNAQGNARDGVAIPRNLENSPGGSNSTTEMYHAAQTEEYKRKRTMLCFVCNRNELDKIIYSMLETLLEN